MKSANYAVGLFLVRKALKSPERPTCPFAGQRTECHVFAVKAQSIENSMVWKLSMFSKTFFC